MPDVLILGGGFAAVWSAAAATRLLREEGADRSVAIVAPGEDLVIRPRLYQADPGAMRIPLDDVLGPIGVERVRGFATSIDTARRSVTVEGHGGSAELSYGRLVVATGSALTAPDLPGAEHLHNVDTVEAAMALDAHLHALPEAVGRLTAVVIGAGFTGLEVATELAGRMRAPGVAGDAADAVRVVLVERSDVLGPELGPGPRPVIASALDELGVERRLGASVTEIARSGVVLGDGTAIPASTVVWTAGVRASPLTRDVPGERDRIGRLLTDTFLRVPGVPGVYAAGDTAAAPAEDGNVTMPSCQHASPLGRHAGRNAAADLLGLAPVPFAPDPYVTCLDLGAAGAVVTTGFERTVQITGAAAKARKRMVNEEWIYPPVHDAEELLLRADHRASTRRSLAAT